MSGHKHAELMLEYAKDAAKTDKPWELWELRQANSDNSWSKCINNPSWSEKTEYRRKPVKWEPVGGDWFINQCDDAVEKWNMSTEETKQAGLERPTQQQADRAFIEMRKFNRLLALRDELCGDDEVDWTNFKQEKFYLSHDEENKRWHIRSSFMSKASVAYFTTLESVQCACNMLNSGEVL